MNDGISKTPELFRRMLFLNVNKAKRVISSVLVWSHTKPNASNDGNEDKHSRFTCCYVGFLLDALHSDILKRYHETTPHRLKVTLEGQSLITESFAFTNEFNLSKSVYETNGEFPEVFQTKYLNKEDNKKNSPSFALEFELCSFRAESIEEVSQ